MRGETGRRPKAILSWSSGKDSAYALHVARAAGEVEVVGLLTTLTDTYGRVSMHGVREELLDRQAAASGLPCTKLRLPTPCTNEIYEAAMTRVLEDLGAQGITHMVFGDLFLEDLRAYRESRLREIGFTAHFPLWKRDTTALAHEMIASGLRATITCVDPRHLDASFAGRAFDHALLASLPAVDPCGENGEFHTFASAGPMFRAEIPISVGPTVVRDGFAFADLLPA